MLEPRAGDRFFTDAAEGRIWRVRCCSGSGCVDHPDSAVAVNARDQADMGPVLAGIGVRAQEKDNVARLGSAGAEASPDSSLELLLTCPRKCDADGSEHSLDEATAVDAARRAAAKDISYSDPRACLADEIRCMRHVAVWGDSDRFRKYGGKRADGGRGGLL